jgi:UDP-N-acetylglucosamine diphosphorylase / glucose-1-phosphate thymidylyltransferase / UDP-N-acetylgalactosamine diphosphorylase / glucosamine-1-phosphate N-acetyltransferase / galactosamine-1-phosphate N-acetyltransferase
MLHTHELFDLEKVSPALRDLLADPLPWKALARLDTFLEGLENARLGAIHPTALVTGKIYLAEGASIGPYALVEGPAWIGPGAQIGHGAYLRGGVVLDAGAKVGHASEVKRAILLAEAKAPHFNYIGDAIVGFDANLGAGVKLANFSVFAGTIRSGEYDTGLRKFGGAIGDEASIGCNAVIAPGTLIGPRTVAYGNTLLRGVYPSGSVVKLRQEQDIAERVD